MSRWFAVVALACAAVAVGCGGAANGPTVPSVTTPRLSRTRFLAFGDSITAGEVTSPVSSTSAFTKLVIVPAASYPSVLQSRLAATFTAQASAISVDNQGKAGEAILEGRLRFNDVFAASQAQAVLLMQGVVNLNIVGPDISTAVMRDMVQRAKNGGASVFVGSMIPSPPGRLRSVNPAFLVSYNSVLQGMSTQEGIVYVDLYTPMLAEAATLIGSDGLHPTEAGYRRIADLFFAAIQQSLQVR